METVELLETQKLILSANDNDSKNKQFREYLLKKSQSRQTSFDVVNSKVINSSTK